MATTQNITVLTATSRNTVKTYRIDAEGKLQCQQYGNEMYFNYRLEQAQDIEQFSTLLTQLSRRKNVILIRGSPKPGLPSITDRKDSKFPEAKDGCYWVMIDFDNLPVPEGMNPASKEAIEYYVRKLPDEFHNASYFYQFSSSAGILNTDGTPLKEGLNVHLFFWFNRPVHGKQLAAYLESVCYDSGFYEKAYDRSEMPVIKTGVDLSVIRSSVQPHYIGLPNILKGVQCTLPLEARQGLVKKRNDAVELPELAESLVPETLAKRKRILNSWKVECGFVTARTITKAAHGGTSVSTYYRNPNGPSPSANRVFLEAKPYGEKQDAVILYFEGENSPGSYFVKKSSPKLATRFGDYNSIPLEELSDGAYAHVRDNLKWFSEIRHVELALTEAGYMPDISSFVTSRNTLIESPTGSGKTHAFCRYAETSNTVLIYAAQTIALVDQMYQDLINWEKENDKALIKTGIRATRYTNFHTGQNLESGVVYVTTNKSLHKFIDAAIAQGVNYELCVDEIHVALDDFMASNNMNELFETAIGRATRSIFMTGTITNLQVPLLDCLKKMKVRQITGHSFAALMKRPSLRGAVKALADNEANYLAWQKKLSRLDEISDQIRNNASTNQKAALKWERFEIAEEFLKTIGVTFFKAKIDGVWITFPNMPFVPNWDFDSMIAVLNRRAESLKRLPEKPVDKELEELLWFEHNVSRELCASCVHCSRDYFCALGRPIQPFWDDIEATTKECDLYRKIPAKLEAREPTKN